MLTFESQIDQPAKLANYNPALFELLLNVYLKHNKDAFAGIITEMEERG